MIENLKEFFSYSLFMLLLSAVISYLCGCINGAILISKHYLKEDVRTRGSGNAGLTNFLRMYGPAKASLVLVIDALKAVVACFLGKLLLTPYGYSQEGLMVGALAVSLGHDFPALLGFRGGKGVLSGVTVALVADWRCGLVALAVFALCLWLTRYVSLSSILGASAFAVVFAILHWQKPFVVAVGIFLVVLIIFMHRSNIARLLNGTEKKATFSKFRRKNKSNPS